MFVLDNGFEIFEYPDYDEKESESAEKRRSVNKAEIIRIAIGMAILIVCSINLFFTVKIYLKQTDYAQVKPIVFQDSNLGVADKNNVIVDAPNEDVETEVSEDEEKTTVGNSYYYNEKEKITENTTIIEQTTKSSSENADKININTASVQELMKLKGVGEKKAQAIVDYRNENGRFETIEDIINVSGIGEKTLENLRDMISVD